MKAIAYGDLHPAINTAVISTRLDSKALLFVPMPIHNFVVALKIIKITILNYEIRIIGFWSKIT